MTDANLTSTPVPTEFPSESDLNYVETIETVISGFDLSDTAFVGLTEQGHIWKFRYGSVEVFVQLTGTTGDDTLTIWSAILSLPVQNEPALLRKLMELNWLTTLEAHFSLFNQQVVVLTTRALAGITASEMARGVTIVATIADEYDDVLRAEFPPA